MEKGRNNKIKMQKRKFIKTVEKPWGREEWIANKQYCGKILTLRKGNQSSFHYHKNKDETFYVLEGKIVFSRLNKDFILVKGDIIEIKPREVHRIMALQDSKLVEFSTHHEDSDSYRVIKGGNVLKAVVLCGGKGTRMKPLTYEIPKPLLPIHGKPILEHIFELLKRYEVADVILCVGHLKDKIKAHVGDGRKLGLRVAYVEESKPLGTAGPLKLAQKMLTETFIVSNGDELKEINLNEMLRQHRETNALATIALTEVNDPSAYGVARLEGTKILEFVEKPLKGREPSRFISAGLYIIEPKVIRYIPKGFAMLERDVFPKIAKEGRLYGYKFKGQWFDTGNFERYEEAIKKWKGI